MEKEELGCVSSPFSLFSDSLLPPSLLPTSIALLSQKMNIKTMAEDGDDEDYYGTLVENCTDCGESEEEESAISDQLQCW